MGIFTTIKMRPKFNGVSRDGIRYDIMEMISILEKYDKFRLDVPNGLDINDEPCAVRSSDKTVTDIFFKNLHIHVKDTETEQIISVRMKAYEDSWTVKVGDSSHPINETFEVYIWYKVPILDLKMIDGEEYISGSWDSTLYKEMKELLDIVVGYTKKARFEESYRGIKNNKKKND